MCLHVSQWPPCFIRGNNNRHLQNADRIIALQYIDTRNFAYIKRIVIDRSNIAAIRILTHAGPAYIEAWILYGSIQEYTIGKLEWYVGVYGVVYGSYMGVLHGYKRSDGFSCFGGF